MHCMMDKKATTLLKNHDENKTYILVKLSESFSNAIQEYSAPTIKFHGPRGAVKFPNGKSYDFSLEQSDNSVECIKQTGKNSRWESVGKIACCLHVKGKDDVYQRTRTKMEAAEQEKRRYCTKLLGSPEQNNTNNISTSSSSTIGGNGGGNGDRDRGGGSSGLSNNSTTNSILSSKSKASHANNNINNHHKPQSSSASLSIASEQNTKSSSLLSSSSSASSSSTSSSSSSTSHIINSNNNNSTNVNNNNSNNNNNNNSSYANLSKYPTITDDKQLKKYKADFDKDFQEYQNLHGYLHRIEERFRKLRELLKQSVEGSPEWESAKEQIFNEYERVKGDSNFHRARSKYKQLYNKLAHIKEKIFQFKRQKRVRLPTHTNNNCNNNKKLKR